MSDSDDLRCLMAANDPNVTATWVKTEDCAEYAEALKGNTHVRKLDVRVSIPYGGGKESELWAMTSWKGFCEVAQELSSLQELKISIFDRRPTRQHFIIVGTILQHLRQVKEISLKTRFPITDPAYGGIIADNISNHPSLELFKLEDFECSRNDSSLPAVLGALLTVPNLKSLDLSPRYCYEDYDEDNRLLSDECTDCLGRLMRKRSLNSIKFWHFEFTNSQVEAMANGIESPESQVEVMTFERCDLPVDAAQMLFRGIARSTSLADLSLYGTVLSGFDFNVHADLLFPLSSCESLKKMYLDLRVGEGETWPRLTFLRTNSVLESLTVDFYSSPISDESLASLFEDLGANEHSNLMELSLRNLEGANVISRNMLAPLATNKSLKKLEIKFNGSGDDDVVVEWPRFDFLQENQALEHFTFRSCRGCVPGGGFESLCQALETNPYLKTLDLGAYSLHDGHCISLARMIGDNVGLEKIVLNGNRFTRECLFNLLPGLARNTSLRVMEIEPYLCFDSSEVGCTDAFARSVLSQTHLRELVVGPWDANDPKPLLLIAAQNYHIERLEFAQNYHIEREFGSQHITTDAYQILKGTIDAIAKLNKAGRGYLGVWNKGQMYKAAGVHVLSNVSDDLDCIFYHLRENPSLCDLRGGVGGAARKCSADIPTTMPDRKGKSH